MNQTPVKILYIVVSTIGLLSFICVSSLCLSLFYHVYADPAIMTAIIAITGGLIGSLGTLLSSTRTQPASTMTTSTTTTSPAAPDPNAAPAPVLIVNDPAKPEERVPTVESPSP